MIDQDVDETHGKSEGVYSKGGVPSKQAIYLPIKTGSQIIKQSVGWLPESPKA